MSAVSSAVQSLPPTPAICAGCTTTACAEAVTFTSERVVEASALRTASGSTLTGVTQINAGSGLADETETAMGNSCCIRQMHSRKELSSLRVLRMSWRMAAPPRTTYFTAAITGRAAIQSTSTTAHFHKTLSMRSRRGHRPFCDQITLGQGERAAACPSSRIRRFEKSVSAMPPVELPSSSSLMCMEFPNQKLVMSSIGEPGGTCPNKEGI